MLSLPGFQHVDISALLSDSCDMMLYSYNLISAAPLYRVLMTTAWHMDPPALFGGFHIAATLIAAASAAFCAFFAMRLTESGRVRLLSVCGWLLLIMEVYKQLFLYFVVNDGVYDWWYFPFQLCSVPMYLCIILPVFYRASVRHGTVSEVKYSLPDASAPESGVSGAKCSLPGASAPRSFGQGSTAGSRILSSPSEKKGTSGICYNTILTFLASYTFISSAAALIIPEDFLRSYVVLTLHGFIWHGILLLISLVILFSGMCSFTAGSFARATVLFLVMCAVAVAINIAAEPSMAAAHSQGLLPEAFAAMFYLNPYHISPQPVVSTIQKSAGIPLGLALYVSVIIMAAGMVILISGSSRRSMSGRSRGLH